MQSSTYTESNKILRRYNENKKDFFRVTFVDEQFKKAFYIQEGPVIIDHILQILINGVLIGKNQLIKFLVYSNS